MTKTKNFKEVIHIQKQIDNLEKNKSNFNKIFLNDLKELKRISHSVFNKVNLDYATREKIFTEDLEFLSINTYYFQDFTFKSFSAYENTVEFQYSLGDRRMMKSLKVPFKFFQMSDRDFATLIRQRIKTYKSENKEKEKREAEKIIAQNEKAIKKLLNENEKLTKFVEKIKEEQNKRADEIVKRMQENLKKNEQKEEVQS